MNNLMLIAEIGTQAGFCRDSATIWQAVGYILLVFKIVIPILLIVFGMIDLGKAVVGSKEDDIKKATQSLMFRAIAAIVIFFIPTLVAVIMTIASGFNEDAKADFDVCKNCIVQPGKKCDTGHDLGKAE